jgi:ABC-2 type transport system ATP-binding protein
VRAALAVEPDLELLGFEDGQLRLALARASERLPRLFEILGGAGAEVRGTTLTRPNLESLFIKLTGKELRE